MQEPGTQSFAVVGDCVASDCTALDLDKLHRVQAHQQVNNHNLLWLLANHFHRTLSCNFFYPSRRIRKKQRTNKKYVGFFTSLIWKIAKPFIYGIWFSVTYCA